MYVVDSSAVELMFAQLHEYSLALLLTIGQGLSSRKHVNRRCTVSFFYTRAVQVTLVDGSVKPHFSNFAFVLTTLEFHVLIFARVLKTVAECLKASFLRRP